MPVPSPRNSIRVARGNYADLAANVTEIGEGELCFASDQDKFYSKSGGSLVAVGGGTELYSIAQLGDVTLTSLSNGQFLQWNGSAWVNVNAAAPVDSVNGQTGTVVLNAADVGAATTAQGALADSAVQPGDLATVATSGSYNDLLDQPTIPPAAPVDSVNGQTGAVVLALDDINDVDLTTVAPNAGEVLGWNGSEWVPTENTGAGSTINSTRYRYESSTDIDTTGAGKVRFNNTDFTLVTEIAFSNIDKNGVDISAVLQNMIDENYSVYFQQEDNAGKAVLFHFTGGCSNVGDGIRSKFPVEHISDSGSALTTNKDCYTVISAQAVADSVTSVNGQQGAVVLSVDDLSDVDTTTAAPTDGQALVWDNTAGKWEPGTVAGGAVDSVNGQTGVVSLGIQDMDDYFNPTEYVFDTFQLSSNPNEPGEYHFQQPGVANNLAFAKEDSNGLLTSAIKDIPSGSTIYLNGVAFTTDGTGGDFSGSGSVGSWFLPIAEDLSSVATNGLTITLGPSAAQDGDILQYSSADSAYMPVGSSGVTFASYVESDLFSVSRSAVENKDNYSSKLSTADTGKHFKAVDTGANTVASINADGSATFASRVTALEVETGSSLSGGHGFYASEGNTTNGKYGTIVVRQDTDDSNANNAFEVRKSSSNPVEIGYDGSATFAGTIAAGGTYETTERTITAGAFNLATGNHWTCGAITVPAPTNATSGTSGLIRITAGPVTWNTVFKFPGGAAPTIASFPAVIPFYVQDSSNILMGNVAEGIA